MAGDIFTNAMQSFMQTRRDVGTHRLLGPAMAGDMEALNRLMAINPEAAGQVQQQQQAQAMAQEQRAAQQQQAQQQALKNAIEMRRLQLEEGRFEREGQAGQKPIVLGEGQTLIDPNTFKILATNEKELDPKAAIESSMALRKELTDVSKTFAIQDDAYGKILASAKNPSPAGDMSLIFNYMKMLDPNSSVREGEYASAAQAGSVPARIIAMYNKARLGTGLEDGMRNDFVTRSKMLYADSAEKQIGRQKRYSTLAEKAGIDPADVVDNMVNFRDPDYQSIIAAAKQNAPAPGAQAQAPQPKFLGFEDAGR